MFELKKILKYRNTIMGIACIMIMVFHSNLPAINLVFFKRYLYIGVDIFLFVSGIGIVQSLSKDSDIKAFYKRRFQRIIPYSVPLIITLGFLLFLYDKDFSVIDFYNHSFLISNLVPTGNYFAFLWYLPTILIYYFVSPFIFHYYKSRKNKTKATIVLLVFCFLLSIITLPNGFLNYLSWITTRFLIYVIGMIYGFRIIENKTIDLWELLFYILLGLFAIGSLIYTMSHYFFFSDFFIKLCFIPLVILFCITVAYIKEYLSLKKIFIQGKIFDYIGNYTLIIYTTHEFFLYLFKSISYYYDKGIRFVSNPYFYSLWVGIFAIIFSIAYSKATQTILND